VRVVQRGEDGVRARRGDGRAPARVNATIEPDYK